MDNHYYAMIMAGGGGTRLWPLSRKDRPKQMLKLAGDRTLFQVAVDRLLGLFPGDNILVVTSAFQAEIFKQQSPEIPAENYIIEPDGRDTAAAIGLAAITLQQRDPEAIMAVVTADHFIEREGRFLHVLRAAQQVAAEGHLVTLGIQPTFPSTGFGYIQQGSYLGTHENIVVFKALNFKEKPDAETAEKFIEGEDHSWNSGMFIWQTSEVLKEFERQMPKLYAALKKIGDAAGKEDFEDVLRQEWQKLDKVSIDFGIMEGAENVAVIPAKGLGWSDVGSWNAVFDALPHDADGNVFNAAHHISEDTKNSLVFTNGLSDRLIVTIGVEDLIIVDTGDVIMVCDNDHAQDVKKIVNKLKDTEEEEYL
jgi:mannose-1-phosphate guanylyltransferase